MKKEFAASPEVQILPCPWRIRAHAAIGCLVQPTTMWLPTIRFEIRPSRFRRFDRSFSLEASMSSMPVRRELLISARFVHFAILLRRLAFALCIRDLTANTYTVRP